MQINVSQQLKGPVGSIRKYELSEVVDISNGSNLVEGEIELTRTDRGILARGTLDTEVELTCGRCLRLFNVNLTFGIEEEYFPTIDIVTGAPLASPDEPDSFIIDEHNILDLTEAISQYALLAIPMKPLCHPDCAGLCPLCGANLNQAACGCQPPTDPGWSKLKELTLAENETSAKE